MSYDSAIKPLALWDSERRKPCPRTPAGLCHFCCLGAEGGGEAIHDVAASAQILAGIGRALRKAAQDQQAVGGEFAGIFGRRIVAWRQGEWHGLDEAGLWLGLEAAQKLLYAGRDEAAHGHEAAHGVLHDAIDFGGGHPYRWRGAQARVCCCRSGMGRLWSLEKIGMRASAG